MQISAAILSISQLLLCQGDSQGELPGYLCTVPSIMGSRKLAHEADMRPQGAGALPHPLVPSTRSTVHCCAERLFPLLESFQTQRHLQFIIMSVGSKLDPNSCFCTWQSGNHFTHVFFHGFYCHSSPLQYIMENQLYCRCFNVRLVTFWGGKRACFTCGGNTCTDPEFTALQNKT